MNKITRSSKAALAAGVLAMAAGLLLPNARAAQADISSTPLASTTSAQVKPNVMLLMDTSGSMGWSHMPDELEATTGVGSVGYKSSQCNALYYNPTTTYERPKKEDGTPFPTPVFTSAPYAGYGSLLLVSDSTDLSTVDLSNSFRAYDGKTLRLTTTPPDAPQAAYYYVYSGTQTLLYSNAPCTDTDTGATRAATGGGTWTRVVVTAAEQQNFAIWYSYYRTRIALTKSAASLAFTPLTNSYRVGFITVQPKDSPTDSTINASKYVAIDDFNSTQRALWFNKLFSQVPGGASPAREGLARVGRHYGGKQDYINAGMTGDPVQYSCQQNFTIMTTDGYWNTQTETPGGGPVQLDGFTLVGNRDNPLTTTPDGLVPRPIFEGIADGNRIEENNQNAYSYASCGSWAYLSTAQILLSSVQNLQSTSQATQSTMQELQSTQQILMNTAQTQQSTVQTLLKTRQARQSTVQNLQSTQQNLQSTSQPTQSTAQIQQGTNQNRQTTTQNLRTTSQTIQTNTLITQTVTITSVSTSQNLRTTAQTTRSTTQPVQSTAQRQQSTVQNLKSTVQNLRSTTQTTQSSTQTLQSTTQNLQSTTQTRQSTTQNLQSTSQPTQTTTQTFRSTAQTIVTTKQTTQSTRQDKSCDARTELCTAVAPGTCSAGGFITCQSATTGPTLVASCTAQTASVANGYYQITCTTTQAGPNGTASCANASPTAANSYTTTQCDSVTTGPTAVQTCAPITASSGNSWTATTCNTTSSGAVPVSSCAAVTPTAANGWMTTTCGSNTTGPTPVQTCTASGVPTSSPWITTTCSTNNTTNVPVASCSPSGPPTASPWITTTCSPNNTTNVPVATCSPITPSSSNGYTTGTCSTNNSTGVGVQTCTPSTGTSANGYVSTVCTPNNTGPTGVQAPCSNSSPNAGNNWVTTTCGTNNTTNVPVASCTASGTPTAAPWITTTCPPAVVTNNVPSQTCSATTASAGNSWTTTTCSTANTTAVPVQTCTASAATSGNNWVTTTCADNNTTNVPVQTCTASGPPTAAPWITTTCGVVATGPTGVASCTASGPPTASPWITTTCGTNNATNTPVQTCAASGPTAANQYVTTTCSSATSGPTPVASCTPVTAAAVNNWTTTSCNTATFSGPTVVGSCTPSGPTAANGYKNTTCGTQVTNTAVATCVPGGTITCATNVVGPTPVQTCTPSGPTAANNYVTTTCSTNNAANVPVATCTASGPTAGNNWVTTNCPAAITTGPTFVGTCAAAAANAGNNFVSTTCTAVNSGPTPVSSCAASGATSGNNWTTTTCGTAITTGVPVLTCTASGPTAGNNWTTTTCPAPTVTTNVPVQTCASSAANSGNNYTATSCSTNNTTNVPVAACSASAGTAGNNWVTTTCPAAVTTSTGSNSCVASPATAGNSWVATTCVPNNTTNVAVQTCTPTGPTSANGYTTTTCTPNNTANVPVATCSASAATSGNGWVTTTCPAPVVTSNVPVQSCSASGPTAANNYTTTTCPAAAVTGPTGVSSCTPIAADAGNNWVATTCNNVTTTNVPVQTCTAVSPSAANSWTTTTCPSPVIQTNVPSASCVAGPATAANNWKATTCNVINTGPTLATTCVPDPASAGNNYTSTTCVPTTGKKIQYATTQTITTTPTSGGTVIGAPVVTSTTSAAADVDGLCYAPGAEPALPSPGPSGNGKPGPNPPTGCASWPCTKPGPGQEGSVNSLADVAQYYYATDLRPSMSNDPDQGGVKSVGTGPEDDRVNWQHMTTFTIGLGVSGTLNYRADYRSMATTSGDFAEIRAGTKAWPLWPDPAVKTDPATGGAYDNWNNPRSIDDFWHAAVNGRGQYFSASTPKTVVAGLAGALTTAGAVTSAGSSGGTSTLQPVLGDNAIYLGMYTTKEWSGDVIASSFDLTSGAVSTSPTWSAKDKLEVRTSAACDNRKIYLIHPGASGNLVPFTWNTQACDSAGAPTGAQDTGLSTAEMANFDVSKIENLSQYPQMTDGTLSTDNQIQAATGANLVNFLRGQRGKEDFEAGNANKLYRKRAAVLGDVIGGQPTYVKAPFATYQDTGYNAFKTANAGRVPMVYVPANDGMLHAFYAGTNQSDPLGGEEAWAIIPSAVLSNLYKLADTNYANIHQFYVDGAPTVADVRDASTSTWKSILVAGLNSGGKGYYAVDVTDPAAPKALWEFKFSTTCYDGSGGTAGADCHLGLTYGKPVITKVKDPSYAEGRWAVLISSGYNNVRGAGLSGDGRGYLYVLDAITGQILYKIDTGAGDSGTPSNLGQLNVFVDDGSVNNTAVRAYGTDMLGNVWRFDVNDTQAPAGREAVKLAQARDSGGAPQPITTRPELAEINGKPMVLVGTGRLLGTTDVTNQQAQTIYGIVDTLIGDPVYADLRTVLKPMELTSANGGTARTIACSTSPTLAGQCNSLSGWYIDLTDSGERVNVDMKLVLSTLVVASNVPTADACSTGGHSWLNYIDIASGEANGSFGDGTGSTTHVSEALANSLVVGVTIIRLPNGDFRTVARTSGGENKWGVVEKDGKFPTPPPTGKRISWREIVR